VTLNALEQGRHRRQDAGCADKDWAQPQDAGEVTLTFDTKGEIIILSNAEQRYPQVDVVPAFIRIYSSFILRKLRSVPFGTLRRGNHETQGSGKKT